MNDENYVEIPFPVGGIDSSGPYHRQKPPTTPDALNVRAFEPKGGRNRGGQRSGLSRFCPVQINSTNPIQELAVITSAGSGPLGTGKLFMHRTDPCRVWNQQAEKVLEVATEGPSNGPACFDTEDNLYFGQVGGTTTPYEPLMVRKFDKSGTLLWSATLFNADTTTLRQMLGLGIQKDILYVCGAVDTAANNVYIWRLDPRTGTILDSGTYNSWLNTTLITWHRIGSIINDFNRQFAVGPTRMVIACPKHDNPNSSTQLMMLDHDGAQVGSTITLKAAGVGTFSVEDVDVDESGNAYVCYAGVGSSAGSGNSNTLRKFDNTCTSQWTVTGTYMTGVTWDPVYSRLVVVGRDPNAASPKNVAIINTSTGANTSSGQVGSNSYLEFARADGRGNYWLGYSTGGNATYYLVDSTFAVLQTINSPVNTGSYWSAANNGNSSTKGTSGSRRTTRLIAVSKGTIKAFDKEGVISVVSGSSVLAAVSSVYAAQNSGVLYFVDNGTTYRKLTLSTMTSAAWTASNGGTIPSSGGVNGRLLEAWRGRGVISGIPGDGQNWFMSRVNDWLDYNYSPARTSALQAVAGNDPRVGKAPDVVNAMCPWSDDILIFGCDHSIHRMEGDPADGGRFRVVSDNIGMAWGRPYCIGPDGTVYFFASRGGVYRMDPGGAPSRLSQKVDEEMQKVNLETNRITMAWDDRQQGLHVFITPLSPLAATNWFWDSRNGGWWKDSFADKNFNPPCVLVYDGDDPNDRAVLLGSKDGYVRFLDINAKSDDTARGVPGTAINSYVLLGPIVGQGNEGVILNSLDGALDADSGSVTWGLLAGESEQAARNAAASSTGTLTKGRFRSQPCRRHGTAIFVKLSNSELNSTWALEWLSGAVKGTGKIRQRAFP